MPKIKKQCQIFWFDCHDTHFKTSPLPSVGRILPVYFEKGQKVVTIKIRIR